MTQPGKSDSPPGYLRAPGESNSSALWVPVSARLDRLAEVECRCARYRVVLELLAEGLIGRMDASNAADLALRGNTR